MPTVTSTATLSIASRVRAFVRLGRPIFLGGGFVMYGLGVALAMFAGARQVEWTRYLWGQLAVTAIQLMTHYANDYFDLAADRANGTPTRWSGGSRVLADGVLPAWVALAAALVLAAVAVAVAARFATGAFPASAAPHVVLMLVLAWFYSAPPLRLCARGLGELTTAVIVTLLVPWLGFSLQRPVAPWLPLAVIQPCVFQFAMLLAIEFPDAAGDATAGKRTLVVRWGGVAAARFYVALVSLSYLALPWWVHLGLPPRIAIGAAVVAPLAAWQVIRVAGGAWRERERWNSLGFWSVALLMATAGCEIFAALTDRYGMPRGY
ncbi:MAG TPA: prenyltransferase [Polyangia bacterium]|nr:prenyltransferase [Polyangia bacterium]